MNKICTSLEQSKKLIELGIDISTADMYWEEEINLPKVVIGNYSLHNQCKATDKDYKKLTNPVLSPAWSLSALLSLLKPYDGETYTMRGTLDGGATIEFRRITNVMCQEDNPLDTVFEMVCWLKESHKI